MPQNPLIDDEPVASVRNSGEELVSREKILTREEAKTMFGKFDWNIESVVDHIYIKDGTIKLADPVQVKRIMAKQSNGFSNGLMQSDNG